MYCPRLEDCYLDMAREANKGKYNLNIKNSGLKVRFLVPHLEETEEAAKLWAEKVRVNLNRENKKWFEFNQYAIINNTIIITINLKQHGIFQKFNDEADDKVANERRSSRTAR